MVIMVVVRPVTIVTVMPIIGGIMPTIITWPPIGTIIWRMPTTVVMIPSIVPVPTPIPRIVIGTVSPPPIIPGVPVRRIAAKSITDVHIRRGAGVF
jgi:hypothetical protein